MGGISGLRVLLFVMNACASDECLAAGEGAQLMAGRLPCCNPGQSLGRVLDGGAKGPRGGRQRSGQSREV